MRGYIKCVDINYNIVYAKKDDLRLLSKELFPINKKYVTTKDKNGKINIVFDNDIRLSNGELFPSASKYIISCPIHGRQQINCHYRLQQVKIPEKYKIYCPKCQEYYLSDKYIPTDDNKNKCIIALKNIHFISSNQQTPKYFKKYMPQFFKIIDSFCLNKLDTELSFSEKIYFLKNGIIKTPKCLFKTCNNAPILVKRPGFGFGFYCEKHKNNNYASKKENEIYDFIRENYNEEIEKNYRKFGNKEIDIFIPKLNIGYEYNGLYWHSEKQKEPKDHYNKFIYFKNQGITIITIWEDDWNYKREIIKSIILNSLGIIKNKINARKCEIKEVNNTNKRIFLDNNHIQGNCSSSINLGLYYDNELVSIMTFGKKRMILSSESKNNEYELLRFCSKCNHIIRGGASKIFKYFIQFYHPNKILSYSNLDIGDGNLYKILNFKNKGYTKINYWWSNCQKRFHRSGFMKHKLIKEGYDKNKTEAEIMNERGFVRIWGIGNNRWEWEKEKGT